MDKFYLVCTCAAPLPLPYIPPNPPTYPLALTAPSRVLLLMFPGWGSGGWSGGEVGSGGGRGVGRGRGKRLKQWVKGRGKREGGWDKGRGLSSRGRGGGGGRRDGVRRCSHNIHFVFFYYCYFFCLSVRARDIKGF